MSKPIIPTSPKLIRRLLRKTRFKSRWKQTILKSNGIKEAKRWCVLVKNKISWIRLLTVWPIWISKWLKFHRIRLSILWRILCRLWWRGRECERCTRGRTPLLRLAMERPFWATKTAPLLILSGSLQQAWISKRSCLTIALVLNKNSYVSMLHRGCTTRNRISLVYIHCRVSTQMDHKRLCIIKRGDFINRSKKLLLFRQRNC